MWNVPCDYLTGFGESETAPGVMLFAPFSVGRFTTTEPFIEYLEIQAPQRIPLFTRHPGPRRRTGLTSRNHIHPDQPE
jgi:hypothetical protein